MIAYYKTVYFIYQTKLITICREQNPKGVKGNGKQVSGSVG